MNKIKKKTCLILVLITLILLIIFEISSPAPFENQNLNQSFSVILTRFTGSILFVILILYLEYDILNIKFVFSKKALIALPCFIVAINNLPSVALIRGDALIFGKAYEILFFAAECVCVAVFEELAFRGVLFLSIMKRKDHGIIFAIAVSSLIFGFFHIVNLFYGSNVFGVILQIGYSILIGIMCAFVMLKTKSVWICAAVHAIYNFCGQIVPRVGSGKMLNLPQIIITVIISAFCAIYIVKIILNTDRSEADRLYK